MLAISNFYLWKWKYPRLVNVDNLFVVHLLFSLLTWPRLLIYSCEILWCLSCGHPQPFVCWSCWLQVHRTLCPPPRILLPKWIHYLNAVKWRPMQWTVNCRVTFRINSKRWSYPSLMFEWAISPSLAGEGYISTLYPIRHSVGLSTKREVLHCIVGQPTM